jgi:excisionase family DNA binding protein
MLTLAMSDAGSVDLYSVREVAGRLGVHPETIRRLIHDGRLEAVRVGRVLRVGAPELERFLERQRVRPVRRPG